MTNPESPGFSTLAQEIFIFPSSYLLGTHQSREAGEVSGIGTGQELSGTWARLG